VTVAAGEQVGQLGQRGKQIDHAKSRDRPPHEVVGDHRTEGRQDLDEVVAVPERRPRDQNEQQSRFEQERDEQEASEQS
jgi:hypothetical protein